MTPLFRPSVQARVVLAGHRVAVFLSIAFAAVVLGLTGAYVLWQFHTLPGLCVGVGLIFLSLLIAVPLQLRQGFTEAKDNAVIIVPIVHDALAGGDRSTDPPCKP